MPSDPATIVFIAVHGVRTSRNTGVGFTSKLDFGVMMAVELRRRTHPERAPLMRGYAVSHPATLAC